MPKISIIVPIYNSEKYLHRCIDSILAQTFTNFELLLINDGSTDKSGEICDEYAIKDSRVRVFHKENGGVSSARNLGLNNAVGEWISFCDSDDVVYSSWLDNFHEKITSTLDLIVQGFDCDKSLCGEKYHQNLSFCGSVNEGLELLFDNKIVGYLWCKLFKRSIIETYNLRFDERFDILEDECFVVSYLVKCNTMVLSNRIGYYYYVPDWNVKYRSENWYEVYKFIYEKIKLLDTSKLDGYKSHILSGYTESLFREFNIRRIKKLLNYRKSVGEDILNTNLFFLTKYIIYFDITGLFSAMIIYFHKSIKRIYFLCDK